MKLKVHSLEKWINCIVSACVLHNWCILEDDGDDFDEVGEVLDNSVGQNLTAEAYMGRRCTAGGGQNKRDLLCQFIAGQP